MINRIIISGDLLRTREVNGKAENFHLKRIDKYYHFFKYQIEEATCLPVEKLNTNSTDFSPAHFYKLCGLEYGSDENWLNIYDFKDLTNEITEYYFYYIKNSLVVYIEMPLIWKRIHEKLGIPYIDLTVHPIRFLDDHMFGMSTNNNLIFDRIKKYQIDDSLFYMQANMIKSIVDYNPLPIQERSALIAGQTNIDKALYSNGRCLSIMDYEDKISEMGKHYDIVYYKAHPFNSDLKKIHDFLKRFDFIKLCPSDWNMYRMLSNDNLLKVYAITSGVLYEAPYFGKESEFLYVPPFSFNYAKECEYDKDTYLSLYNSYMNPRFWSDILQDIISVNANCRNVEVNYRANRIRATFNDYWSYTELDPDIITVGKQYNDRVRRVEKEVKQIISLQEKLNYADGYITQLNNQISILNNKVGILQQDPCFEKNVLKRWVKRATFSLSQKSTLFNPIIVLAKLKQESKKYIENKCEITAVKGITYRPHAPHGGRGGGGAVLSAMQAILQDKVGDYQIKYNYSERDGIWHTLRNRYFTYSNYQRYINEKSNLLPLYAAVCFVIEKTKNEQGTLYVCHEYATAYGLSLLNKKYVLVIHSQGTRVDEKLALGEKLTQSEINVIKKCEKVAIENALCVCFPSIGAEEMYFSSKYCIVRRSEVNVGACLYNTVYAEVTPKRVEGMGENEKCLTFMSVGTLTSAKGQDNVCRFLAEFMKYCKTNVRWICVGKGPMYETIAEITNDIKKHYPNFEFVYFSHLDFSEVQYLYSIADVYIMLHRISVFDLSTLEAMKNSCAIVLSKVGGNLEYNLNDNILYTEDDIVDKLLNAETIVKLKKQNIDTYNDHFSPQCFRDRYTKLLLNTVEEYNRSVR